MEIIFEIVIQLVVEIIGEALIEVGWRGAHGATRDALGLRSPSTAQRVLGLVLTVMIAAGVGFWRGSVVGDLGWGWWFAVTVTVVATAGALVRVLVPAGPRPPRFAALNWWPASRLAWFAVANGVFVVTYALGQVDTTPVLR
jgi:hypothetical protein